MTTVFPAKVEAQSYVLLDLLLPGSKRSEHSGNLKIWGIRLVRGPYAFAVWIQFLVQKIVRF